ncbi:MAG: hypothetical protein JW941_06600, partial [Candidatus Coatesbacteria bacterium]|nr:hypothetical protein [Candidatus Coatesbacteria bacterium]
MNKGNGEEPRIAWSTLPLIERPLTSVGVILFIGLILMGIYFWFHSIYWVILAAVMLFLSLSAYFIPTTYKLYEDEIVIKRVFTTQKKKWEEFKRVYKDS